MKTHVKQPQKGNVAQPKVNKQADAGTILKSYNSSVQRQSTEEEDPLQKASTTQMAGQQKEEEPLQGKFKISQLVAQEEEPLQRAPNTTGLPDNLKTGVENLSGHSLDDVKVHYNSAKPAALQAHAYAQGTNIHVAPGQEKHLPHEAWHVVQQKQGRVKPTMQMKGNVNVNDDAGLEKEADVMGARAVQMKPWSLGNLDGKNTDVNWATDTLKGSTVGVHMIANPLGPEHLQGGPPKSSAQKSLMSKLPTDPTLANDQKYIRGHLLNDNVGGPGDDFNLFPITANANKEHENKIESVVKDWVNIQKQWVKYEVKVENVDTSKGYVDSIFNCNAQVIGSTKKVQAVIKSEYSKTHTGKAAQTPGFNMAVGAQASGFNPLWSTSKQKTTTLDKEVIETLAYLFNEYPTETRKLLLSLKGVGATSVNTIESSLEEDYNDMNSFGKSEMGAFNKVMKHSDILEKLAQLYMDVSEEDEEDVNDVDMED